MTLPRLPVTLLAIALALAACVTPRVRSAQAESDADNQILLREAERAVAKGDARDAHAALQRVTEELLDREERPRYQLLQAEAALLDSRPVVALQALPPPGTLSEPREALRAEGLRARALFAMGDAVGATQAMLARERWLPEGPARATNRDELWAGLRSTDLDTAAGSRLAQADVVTRGWVELALISRSVWLDPRDLEARLAQWHSDYPAHPAAERIPTLAVAAPLGERRPIAALALLLPLSGPHTASAEAIRDGFFAAFFATDPAARPAARVYDTGGSPETLRAAYRQALDDGAEFLVGPLLRENVAALADAGRPAVPVLALNFLDPGRVAPFNFFQWGLAPEDEARQAAERAVAEGHFRAAALVPQGDWGARVLGAFRERLEALGGNLVASQTYEASAQDHSDAIRTLLALDASQARHRVLTNMLGVKTHFEPRRRMDVDLVFVGARQQQARLLVPQLRFHRTGELPLWATALVYEGEPPPADLNGLRFCDMPWMLEDDGPWASLRSQLHTLFPKRPRDYTRLLALGHDAYTLVRLIDGGQLPPGTFYPAASGMLSIRDDRVIARGLGCAEVRNGAIKPLDLPAAAPR